MNSNYSEQKNVRVEQTQLKSYATCHTFSISLSFSGTHCPQIQDAGLQGVYPISRPWQAD